MSKHSQFRVVFLMAAALAVSGCSLFKRGGPPKTPVLGERIPVLAAEGDIQVDPAVATLPMTLPPAVANTEWSQAGGNANKSMGQLALGTALGQAWSVKAGNGSNLTMRLASPPVYANGRVYAIDTMGAVRAFDGKTGGQVWASQTPNLKGNESSLYGGGIAYSNGRIIATNGLGFVSSLDQGSGGIVWQVRPGGPLRGSPSVADGAIYVMSQDNQIFSLSETDGKTNWSQAAALEIAGIFGSASPAVGQGTVVGGFSSGELNAYRYENGRMVWQDALQRTSIRTSVASLSDIDASPVIDSGQVIALGQGGRMVALDLISGQRQWELNIAGIATPWVIPEWVFVVTDDAKLLCIARSNGHVRWMNQLPQFDHPKSKKGQIDYKGPVLAGGRLLVVGSNGVIVNVDPSSGSYLSQTRVASGISLPPIVADNTLYVYDDAAQLHAYR